MKCRDSSRQVRNSRSAGQEGSIWRQARLSPPPFLPPLPSPPMGPVEQKPQSLPESNSPSSVPTLTVTHHLPAAMVSESPSPGRAPTGWRQGVPWVRIGGHIPRVQWQRKATWETVRTSTKAQRYEAAGTHSPSSKGPRL